MNDGSVMIIFFIAAVLYFTPSIIAFCNKHKYVAPIFIINVCLGWTIFGWAGAMVWALIKGESK